MLNNVKVQWEEEPIQLRHFGDFTTDEPSCFLNEYNIALVDKTDVLDPTGLQEHCIYH